MSLLNPVKVIGQTFQNLNEKRIANLMGKRAKEVSGTKFRIGQFVLLADEFDPRAEARAKISIPHRNRLYKIVNFNKDGFTASILDVLSGSKKEVLSSRLCAIDLQTLEMFHFSTPTFFHNLQKLTDAVRRKYVPPPRAPATNLQLLGPDDVGEDGVSRGHDGGGHRTDGVSPGVTDTNNIHSVSSTGHSSTDHSIYNNHSINRVPGTDDILYDVEHGVVTDSPYRNGSHVQPSAGGDHLQERPGVDEAAEEGGMDRNEMETAGNGVEDVDEEKDRAEDDEDAVEERDVPKRKTRYQGAKHVPVYKANSELGSHETNKSSRDHRSILKSTNYQISHNYIADQLKALNKANFYARKSAFSIHSQVCDQPSCPACLCARKVSHLTFDPANFSRYTYNVYPEIIFRNKSNDKKVTFDGIKISENNKYKRFHLSKNLVEKACNYCISFKEVNILCKNP